MRRPHPRPVRIFARPGRSRPLRYLATVTAVSRAAAAVAEFAAQSCAYAPRELRAYFA